MVQLEEAKRMIELDSQPHRRLALLLLDNAAEVIMSRMIDRLTMLNDMHKNTIDLCQSRPRPLVLETAELLAESEAMWVSPRQFDKLNRFFEEKAKFLVKRGKVEEPVALALRKLHVYRNEAYHRDKLRPGSLVPSVLIYFDLACELFGRWQPSGVTISPPIPAVLKKYLKPGELYAGYDVMPRIADALRSELKLDLPAVREALIQHLSDRLDQIDDLLKFIAEESARPRSVADTLHVVQAVTDENALASDEELLATKVKFSMRDLENWRARVARIERLDDRLKMFTAFARIEDEFESLEAQVLGVAAIVDQYVEDQIDFMRGM
ncbi:hypothetical protein ACLQ22_05300 [Micromonospora sp. DT178]|uniref:hypothetical protein n=1 Tax=Micromonospora sp. DT178 TaxID=3393436 RepID=UPI003CF90672